MKFENHRYWKHKNCMDVFISVSSADYDYNKKNVILWCTWYTQGVYSYWPTEAERIEVTPDHYDNWQAYEPKGEFKI